MVIQISSLTATQYFKSLASKAIQAVDFGSRNLKHWVLGPATSQCVRKPLFLVVRRPVIRWLHGDCPHLFTHIGNGSLGQLPHPSSKHPLQNHELRNFVEYSDEEQLSPCCAFPELPKGRHWLRDIVLNQMSRSNSAAKTRECVFKETGPSTSTRPAW